MCLVLTMLVVRVRYTGRKRHAPARREGGALGLRDALRLFAEVRSDRRLVTMIVLGGATAFFVGNAFQAQMPEYAHHLGTDEAGVGYSVLLAANAVGAVIGALLLEGSNLLPPTARTAILCAAAGSVTIGLFPAAPTYGTAVALLVLAGVFNIAFTSMAQTLVQLLAPPTLRGRIVGLFNTAMLGLRAGSGLTVGVLGAVIGVQWSLALSAAAVLLIAGALLAYEARAEG